MEEFEQIVNGILLTLKDLECDSVEIKESEGHQRVMDREEWDMDKVEEVDDSKTLSVDGWIDDGR